MKDIKVVYNGEWPNLCSGELTIIIDGKHWRFPNYCLSSEGSVSFTDDWNEVIDEGPWEITNWPEGFPEDLKKRTLDIINQEIPHGCCGGCV